MSDHTVVLAALDELLDDFKQHPEDWENRTLESYLESTRAWLEAWQKKNNAPLTWELVARLMCAARHYE